MADSTIDGTESVDLVHYGMLGMKWGVRKDRQRLSDGTLKERIKRKRKRGAVVKKAESSSRQEVEAALERRKASKPKPRPASTLTDEELQAFIRRAQLEQQYMNLTAVQKSKSRKVIEDFLKDIAKQQARALVNEALGAGIKAARKK